MDSGVLRIGEVAGRASVNVQTLRFYERRGLLAEPPRRASGYREYPVESVRRVRFIKRAQVMGFSLEEIKGLLRLRTHPSCSATRELAVRKVGIIDAHIRELRQLRKELVGLVAACDTNAEDSHCPVIERLAH